MDHHCEKLAQNLGGQWLDPDNADESIHLDQVLHPLDQVRAGRVNQPFLRQQAATKCCGLSVLDSLGRCAQAQYGSVRTRLTLACQPIFAAIARPELVIKPRVPKARA
jgi:hypothetical protein